MHHLFSDRKRVWIELLDKNVIIDKNETSDSPKPRSRIVSPYSQKFFLVSKDLEENWEHFARGFNVSLGYTLDICSRRVAIYRCNGHERSDPQDI